MLAVWRGAAAFRGESSARSWVIAIARRQTRDRLRGQRLRVVDDASLANRPGSGPGPEVTALDRAELAEVRVAIRDLAPGPHRGHRVQPDRADRRNARAGERHQPGHQDAQRSASNRDHDGDYAAERVRRAARRHHGRDDGSRDGTTFQCGDHGRFRHPRRRRHPASATGPGRRRWDGIGREHHRLHHRHVRGNPGSRDQPRAERPSAYSRPPRASCKSAAAPPRLATPDRAGRCRPWGSSSHRPGRPGALHGGDEGQGLLTRLDQPRGRRRPPTRAACGPSRSPPA
jgi:hypothetical protein